MANVWAFLTKKRYLNWPYLSLYIRLPFFHVETHLMTQRIEMDTFDYIAVRVRVWKWETTFRLYQPNKALYYKHKNI